MNEALYILFDRKCHDIVDIINVQHKISDMLRSCGMKYVGDIQYMLHKIRVKETTLCMMLCRYLIRTSWLQI